MTQSLTEFLLARIAEDEAVAQAADVKQEDPRWWPSKHIDGATVRSERDNRPMARVECLPSDEDDSPGSTSILDPHEVAGHIARHNPARVLAECEAKRRIVKLHESWPVLVQSPPTFERVDSADLSSIALRASQQMAWLTEQEYRTRFGTEPPTAPMLAALALVYADHPDYDEAWRP